MNCRQIYGKSPEKPRTQTGAFCCFLCKSPGFPGIAPRLDCIPMRASTYRRAKNVQEIGREMYRLADSYSTDLGELAGLPLDVFFDKVKQIPYRKEPGRFQFLSRPQWVLSGLSPVVACANKAIMVGAWAKQNRFPFRFVAVGTALTRPVNHVYTQIFLAGLWQNVDPTYNWHSPFHVRPWARFEVLKRK